MKKYLKMIIVIAPLAIASVASVSYFMPEKLPKGVIRTSGIIEAAEVNLGSKITERVKEVRFIEGDYIKKGEAVILLDDEKRKAEYEQAEANLEAAKADLLNAAADIEKANVRIIDTKRDMERNSKLLERKLVSQNDKDKAQTNYELAVSDLNKAKAREALAIAGVRQSDAALKVAKTDLEDTVIISTLSGVVTLKAFEAGEMAPAGATVLTVIDLSDMWVRVDVEETVVSKIKLGDIARIKVDGLPDEEFKGRVSEINSEGEFATQRDVKRGRQDIKTFRVKAKIDGSKGILKQGMTATVAFVTG